MPSPSRRSSAASPGSGHGSQSRRQGSAARYPNPSLGPVGQHPGDASFDFASLEDYGDFGDFKWDGLVDNNQSLGFDETPFPDQYGGQYDDFANYADLPYDPFAQQQGPYFGDVPREALDVDFSQFAPDAQYLEDWNAATQASLPVQQPMMLSSELAAFPSEGLGDACQSAEQQNDPALPPLDPILHNDYGEELLCSPESTRSRRQSTRSSYSSSSRSTGYSPRNSNGSSRYSSSSAHGSERAALKASRMRKHRHSQVAKYKFEKPKADPEKSWVRINTTTKGLTTRTAKINNYEALEHYDYDRPHPLGTGWQGPKTEFKYTKKGEWSQATYSSRQVMEFIYEYPKTNRLKLWIQKGPTDSARRYPTTTWSKCRFKDCPAQVNQTGTILHGHYRVSFDETWHKNAENVDPFLTTGYVHLYCMERFLDFAEICRKFDVEVDTRTLPNEPKNRFAATLANAPEASIAMAFIEGCRNGTLREIKEFAHYPRHKDYKHGAPKPHKHTLTYAMTKAKADTRPPAQRAQFEARGIKNSHLIKNMGDLEVLFAEVVDRKKRKRMEAKKRKAKRLYDSDEDTSGEDSVAEPEPEPEPRPRKKAKVAESRKRKAHTFQDSDDDPGDEDFPRHKKAKAAESRKRKAHSFHDSDDDSGDEDFPRHKKAKAAETRKRKAHTFQDSDDDSGDEDFSRHKKAKASPTRASPRLRGTARPNYAEEDDGIGPNGVQLISYVNNQQDNVQGPHLARRRHSSSQSSGHFQNKLPIDPSLYNTFPNGYEPAATRHEDGSSATTDHLPPPLDFDDLDFAGNTDNVDLNAPLLTQEEIDALDAYNFDQYNQFLQRRKSSLRIPKTPVSASSLKSSLKSGTSRFSKKPRVSFASDYYPIQTHVPETRRLTLRNTPKTAEWKVYSAGIRSSRRDGKYQQYADERDRDKER